MSGSEVDTRLKCGYCDFDNAEKLQRCSRCQSVFYCSKDHQVAHWKVHRPICKVASGKTTEGAVGFQPSHATSNLTEGNLQKSSKKNSKSSPSKSKEMVESSFDEMMGAGRLSFEVPPPEQPNGSNDFGSKKNGKRNSRKGCKMAPSSTTEKTENLENFAPGSSLENLSLTSGSPPPTLQNSSGRTPPFFVSNSSGNNPGDSPEKRRSFTDTNKGIPFLHRNINFTSQRDTTWMSEICLQLIKDMNRFGVCVVDNLLGDGMGDSVLAEVHALRSKGAFRDGQLVKEQKVHESSKSIRGDQIVWLDGKEPNCENIAFLINLIDSIVMGANRINHNGKLASYNIKERTKAMVSCYPGSGTQYIKHVDNPNHDGRCITAIYYLNKNWNTKEFGGLLRIFPEGWTNQVADIEPLFDRVLFFWSDRRNPHEVQPAFKTRYALTLWYFDAKEKEAALSRDQHEGK